MTPGRSVQRIETETWPPAVVLADVPEGGLEITISLGGDQRADMKARYGLIDLPEFTGWCRLSRHGRYGIALHGRLTATMTRECGVTLEPFETGMDTEFERLFLPVDPKRTSADLEELVLDPEADEQPDPLTPEGIELKDVFLEAFDLALDPYPRGPNADVKNDDHTLQTADETESPFAALSQLRKTLG